MDTPSRARSLFPWPLPSNRRIWIVSLPSWFCNKEILSFHSAGRAFIDCHLHGVLENDAENLLDSALQVFGERPGNVMGTLLVLGRFLVGSALVELKKGLRVTTVAEAIAVGRGDAVVVVFVLRLIEALCAHNTGRILPTISTTIHGQTRLNGLPAN